MLLFQWIKSTTTSICNNHDRTHWITNVGNFMSDLFCFLICRLPSGSRRSSLKWKLWLLSRWSPWASPSSSLLSSSSRPKWPSILWAWIWLVLVRFWAQPISPAWLVIKVFHQSMHLVDQDTESRFCAIVAVWKTRSMHKNSQAGRKPFLGYYQLSSSWTEFNVCGWADS